MGANVVLMSCKQYKIIVLLNKYLLISSRAGEETRAQVFSPETGLMKQIISLGL